jgi:LPS-assembly protein
LDYKVTKYRFFSVLFIFFFAYSICSGTEPACAADGGPVQVSADRISFEESTGFATAEGNVVIEDANYRVEAPYAEYDSASQQIRANASPGTPVSLITAGRRLDGETLDYNLVTRRGNLTDASGLVDVFYVEGDRIEVMPQSEALPQKRRGIRSRAVSDDLAAIWRGASVTTCDYPHPHYRLETARVTIVPNRRLIIKMPRVYLGDTLVFIYPFDATIPLTPGRRRAKHSVFPRFGYESDKGAGFGLSGEFGWETGAVDVGVITWTGGITEGNASISQEFGDGFTAYASSNRVYDKDRRITDWRPNWGLTYERDGWHAGVRWSQRELLSVEKRAGEDSRYVLWRKPEVSVLSPWFDAGRTGARLRTFATWGTYEDATSSGGPVYRRTGAGAQLAGEIELGNDRLRPFYNTSYWYFNYDDEIDRQQVLDAALGVQWKLGKADLRTTYLRRWVSGFSPMWWDLYKEREEIYQEAAMNIPTRNPDLSWRVGVRAAYDLSGGELAEMAYLFTFDEHCLLWEAIYRDDQRGDDDWFGLSVTIKDFPQGNIRLGGNELSDPSDFPNSLAPAF